MASRGAAGAARPAAHNVWQLWQQQQRGLASSSAAATGAAGLQGFGFGGITAPSSKRLWDIVKRDLFEKHNAQQVSDIWMEFHADPKKHRVAAVIPAAQYLKFTENAQKSPNFVLPVFRGPNAFENFMIQCQDPVVLFTTLEQYKRDGPAAPPHFMVTHYTELIDEKGIVLIRGDIVQPNAVSIVDAQALLRMVHQYYTDPQKHAFVWAFNHNQSEFDFKRLLDSMGHDTSQLPR